MDLEWSAFHKSYSMIKKLFFLDLFMKKRISFQLLWALCTLCSRVFSPIRVVLWKPHPPQLKHPFLIHRGLNPYWLGLSTGSMTLSTWASVTVCEMRGWDQMTPRSQDSLFSMTPPCHIVLSEKSLCPLSSPWLFPFHGLFLHLPQV